MGLLDKAKQLAAQAEASVNSATAGQGNKVADTWLKQLGQWVYAERMGRDPRAAAEIDVLVAQLQRHEAEHGPLPTPIPTPGTAPGPAATDPVLGPSPQPEPMPMPDPAPIPDPDPAPAPLPGGLSTPSPAAPPEAAPTGTAPAGPPTGMASPPGD